MYKPALVNATVSLHIYHTVRAMLGARTPVYRAQSRTLPLCHRQTHCIIIRLERAILSECIGPMELMHTQNQTDTTWDVDEWSWTIVNNTWHVGGCVVVCGVWTFEQSNKFWFGQKYQVTHNSLQGATYFSKSMYFVVHSNWLTSNIYPAFIIKNRFFASKHFFSWRRPLQWTLTDLKFV